MPIDIKESVDEYLKCFTRRADGQIGALSLGKREVRLVEIIQAMAAHISIYDAAGNLSQIMCHACAHHRHDDCPIVHVTLLLKDLRRNVEACPKGH